MSSTFDRDPTFTLYCNLMAEIKNRHTAVVWLFHNPVEVPPEFLAEFCYLQLRKMCELLAVGCLAVHGDVATINARLRGAYQADMIMRALSKLNPDFYPIPVMFGPRDHAGGGPALFEPITEGFLTKDELLLLYNQEAGNLMHLGNLDDLRAGRKVAVHKDKMEQWFIKFQRLLTNHRILLYGSNEEIWVDMSLPGMDVEARSVERGG